MRFGAWLAMLPLAVPAAVEAPFPGLPRLTAIAFNRQGALFATTSDAVVQILGPKLIQTLAPTAGTPGGLAIAASGDLYVAVPERRAVLKVAQSGGVSVAVDSCGGKPLQAPSDVAIASGDAVYFVDRNAVCRNHELISAAIANPSAIAASADGRAVYAGDREGRVWRLGAMPRQIASVGAPVTGLALDGSGNVYIASGGVRVVTPRGAEITGLRVQGEASDVVFGAADPESIFIAAGKAIHRLAVPYARDESRPALRITAPVDGAILNRHDGEAVRDGLRITVRGRGPNGVRVNGRPARVKDGEFTATVTLDARENKILAEAGRLREEIAVLWDKDSFPRYRVSVDDNIRWLKDIALRRPAYVSIFENPYLASWRELHRKYGAKVHFNIYYETSGFNLSQMPDRYKREWQANADWIRLSFHARANDPDRPYLHSTGERIREDYRLVNREIERFAGKELMTDVTTIHWGETTPAAVDALREEGVRVLVGYFELRRELPSVSYDVPMPVLLHLKDRDYWKDTRRGLLFARHDMVINGVNLEDIVPQLDKLTAHQSEVIELMIHEQHYFPDFKAGYRPDYFERIERAVQWAVKRGCKPVFFGEGFLGAK